MSVLFTQTAAVKESVCSFDFVACKKCKMHADTSTVRKSGMESLPFSRSCGVEEEAKEEEALTYLAYRQTYICTQICTYEHT